MSLLREFRGDGHIAALSAAGLSGIESIVTHTATGRGFLPEQAKLLRGWSDAQWGAAQESLTARGLLDSEGELTAAGAQLRASIEATTDQLDSAPWAHLGHAQTVRLIELGRPLARLVAKAGAFPAGVFATGSSR